MQVDTWDFLCKSHVITIRLVLSVFLGIVFYVKILRAYEFKRF